MEQMGLSGEAPLGETKTKATDSNYRKNEPSVADTAGGGRAGLPQARGGDR